MNAINRLDSDRINALSYIVNKKYGFVHELLEQVKESIVREFVSLGFVIMGYTTNDKTWRVSDFAVSFYDVVK